MEEITFVLNVVNQNPLKKTLKTNKMGTLKDFTKQGVRSMLPVIKNIPFVIKLGTLKNSVLNTIANKSILRGYNKRVNNKELVTLTSNILVRLIHTLRDKSLRICPIVQCGGRNNLIN